MERQTVNIKIITEGDNCEMSSEEIKKWYETKISELFNSQYGTPEIEVELKREEI